MFKVGDKVYLHLNTIKVDGEIIGPASNSKKGPCWDIRFWSPGNRWYPEKYSIFPFEQHRLEIKTERRLTMFNTGDEVNILFVRGDDGFLSMYQHARLGAGLGSGNTLHLHASLKPVIRVKGKILHKLDDGDFGPRYSVEYVLPEHPDAVFSVSFNAFNLEAIETKTGVICKICGTPNEYAISNQSDGSYVCYEHPR